MQVQLGYATKEKKKEKKDFTMLSQRAASPSRHAGPRVSQTLWGLHKLVSGNVATTRYDNGQSTIQNLLNVELLIKTQGGLETNVVIRQARKSLWLVTLK